MRNSPFGYLGAWVIAILGPTSFVPILLETAAERRMYLPLVAVVALVVLGVYVISQRWLFPIIKAKGVLTIKGCQGLLAAMTVMVALALGLRRRAVLGIIATRRIYGRKYSRSNLTISWRHGNLGSLLSKSGRNKKQSLNFRRHWL